MALPFQIAIREAQFFRVRIATIENMSTHLASKCAHGSNELWIGESELEDPNEFKTLPGEQ